LISSVKLIFNVLKEAIEKGISDFENNVVAIKDEENKTERKVKKVEKTPRANAEAPKNEVSEKVTPKKVEKTVAKKPVVNDINLNDKSKLKNVLSGNKAK
jgi:hypothetical protein